MNTLWKRGTMALVVNRILKNAISKNSSYAPFVRNCVDSIPSLLKANKYALSYSTIRHKTKKVKADSDDEDNIIDDDSSLSRDSKVVNFNTTSMRTDAILKLALGVARNKIEQVFYESKIRVNGKKILKKSYAVRIGDEIDIIKSISPKNPNHLHISRVELLNVTAQEDSILVKARRFKTLLIENYEVDPYKATSSSYES